MNMPESPHPDAEKLRAYVQGRSTRDFTSVHDHVLACPNCSSRCQGLLDGFPESEGGARNWRRTLGTGGVVLLAAILVWALYVASQARDRLRLDRLRTSAYSDFETGRWDLAEAGLRVLARHDAAGGAGSDIHAAYRLAQIHLARFELEEAVEAARLAVQAAEVALDEHGESKRMVWMGMRLLEARVQRLLGQAVAAGRIEAEVEAWVPRLDAGVPRLEGTKRWTQYRLWLAFQQPLDPDALRAVAERHVQTGKLLSDRRLEEDKPRARDARIDTLVAAARALLTLHGCMGHPQDLEMAARWLHQARDTELEPGNPLLAAWRQEASALAQLLAGGASGPAGPAALLANSRATVELYIAAGWRHGTSPAWRNHAVALALVGRSDEAEQGFRRTLELAGANPDEIVLTCEAWRRHVAEAASREDLAARIREAWPRTGRLTKWLVGRWRRAAAGELPAVSCGEYGPTRGWGLAP